MAGDLSPLAIESPIGGRRTAPPALVVAVAVGLGSVDMPVPSVAEWEWLNWKFPRPIHAGDTIYARWTLTQKRPPVAGAPSSIVVWRVDVHTLDGALCAEGEIGAKVKRAAAVAARPEVQEVAQSPAPRRRRRRSRANGTAAVEPPAVAAPPAAEAKPERTATGGSRRRRRRRPAGSAGREEEHEPRAAHVQESAPAPAAAAAPPATAGNPRGLTGVLRRLRRP